MVAIDDGVAQEAIRAIRAGNVQALAALLGANPELPRQGLDDGRSTRTLLHVLTDWPGRAPNGREVVRLLVSRGADVDARFVGPHEETPLHWAASSGDLQVLDALLDAGADIEAPGGVIGGGPPLADAVAFGQWAAASRLLARGARANLWQAAALGLLAQVVAEGAQASAAAITTAFWCACHGGQAGTARHLLDLGADLNWRGFDGLTPLGAARRSGAEQLVRCLVALGARE
jgi:ankyrin repeat protein